MDISILGYQLWISLYLDTTLSMDKRSAMDISIPGYQL